MVVTFYLKHTITRVAIGTTDIQLLIMGLNVTGGHHPSGNVTIGGTLTYEDVTNIDSVGLITARSGINVSAGGINVTGITTFQHHLSSHLGDDDILYIGDDNDTNTYETGGDVGINYQTTGGTLMMF